MPIKYRGWLRNPFRTFQKPWFLIIPLASFLWLQSGAKYGVRNHPRWRYSPNDFSGVEGLNHLGSATSIPAAMFEAHCRQPQGSLDFSPEHCNLSMVVSLHFDGESRVSIGQNGDLLRSPEPLQAIGFLGLVCNPVPRKRRFRPPKMVRGFPLGFPFDQDEPRVPSKTTAILLPLKDPENQRWVGSPFGVQKVETKRSKELPPPQTRKAKNKWLSFWFPLKATKQRYQLQQKTDPNGAKGQTTECSFSRSSSREV